MPACRQPGCSSSGWVSRVGCSRLQPDGGRREEPEGVEVRAPDRVRLDDGVRALPARAGAGPGAGCSSVAVDHRPLVQAEAAGERRARRGRGEQPAHEADGVARGRPGRPATSSRTVPSASVAYQRQAACGAAGGDGAAPTPGPGASGAAGPAGLRVVREEEVQRPGASRPRRRRSRCGAVQRSIRAAWAVGQRRPLVRRQHRRRQRGQAHGQLGGTSGGRERARRPGRVPLSRGRRR